tara:strand:+ start:2495 stop:3238 length:744 start_codon:yes stop_codon:yes gene_type:complete
MPVAQSDDKVAIKITPLHVPFSGGKDASENALTFSPIITQYEDKWSPNWKPQNVYGRMDPLGFYAGTQRELVLGFRVISDSVAEAEINMAKIEKLIQYQYPSWKKEGGKVSTLKAPPYFTIQFMNLTGEGTQATNVQGYFTAPITINPGFQTKDKSQYFAEHGNKLYFSDVEIGLRMTVLHVNETGFYHTQKKPSNAFGPKNGTKNKNYPYGIPISKATSTAPSTSPVLSNRQNRRNQASLREILKS